ncbi:MAG TPA: TldD/PmbA family protein [Spirochaetota bacterium]|nr:TldD/PmbA family protein [Spirochaetota bacterium]
MIDRVRGVLSGRARWYDIIHTWGASTPLSFANNRFHSITERHNSGYGIRVNVDGKTGFSYTNDPSRLAVTAERALALAAFGDEEDFELPAAAGSGFEPWDDAIESFDTAREAAGAEEDIAAILARFPAATVDAGISRYAGGMRLVNSRGLDATFRSCRYSASLSATLIMDDGTRIDASESMSALAPAAHPELRETIIRNIGNALSVARLPSGTVPVLLTPRAFARLAGIVLSGLNARSVWKGISPFGEKRGERIFNPSLTVRDNPLAAGFPDGYPFDDEGVAAADKVMIGAGRIERFITDLKHAQKLGIPAEGNGARGFSSLPYPSYSNIIIDPGMEPREAILAGMGRGILVEQFIGLGQSNTITGDFSGSLELAFLVENGRIAGRVKDCMISDNIFRLLAGDIVMSAERERMGSVLAPSLFLPSVNFTG